MQLVAEQADLGTGTLFRGASSEAELLMMVMNEQMRLDTRRGFAAAASGTSRTEAILALLGPQIKASEAQPENTALYQREVVFGHPARPHRRASLRGLRAGVRPGAGAPGDHHLPNDVGRGFTLLRSMVEVVSTG
jgi:hypothetical protein